MKQNYFLISFIIILLNLSGRAVAQENVDNIRLNQLGFYPNGPKIAVIVTKAPATSFFITTASGKDTLLKGKLSPLIQSGNSSLKTQIADFSSFNKVGSFKIGVSGSGTFAPFSIGNEVTRSVAILTLKGFYYQRVSMPLEAKYAGKWARPAGNPDTKVLVHPSAASAERPAGTVISTPGGWYDAGDYNKYVVNSGITMGTLLSAYEDFPDWFDRLKTNIPESGNGLPDLLNEALYNLRWMLTMQDPNDGGVYHKCTHAAFDGMVMPGVTQKPRYVVQKGTAATLDFAAVMAQAARIVKHFPKQLPGLADSCLSAATHAWQWSLQHPAVEYDQNQINNTFEPKITTGAYGDRSFKDEWFWAAAELFVTSGDKNYFDQFSKSPETKLTLPSWANVYALGVYSLLRAGKQLPDWAVPACQTMKENVLQLANQMIAKAKESAFQTVMGQSPRDFVWGSNSGCANQAILMINAFRLTNELRYVNAALSNLDYLLGRNATGYCFITGAGSHSPMHPHHRSSVADGIEEPVPGLLVGGPNPGRQDGCTYPSAEPELAYADLAPAYAANEIAINWNAPMVYLANAIEALKFKAGFVGKTGTAAEKQVKSSGIKKKKER